MATTLAHRVSSRDALSRYFAGALGDALSPPANYFPGGELLATSRVEHAEGTMDVVPTDSKLWTGSVWYTVDGGAGGARAVLHGENARFQVRITAANAWLIQGRNAAGTVVLSVTGAAAAVDAGVWHHLHWAVDMADSAQTRVHVDGVEDSTVTTFTTDEILDGSFDTWIGADHTAGSHWDGRLSQLWVAWDAYLPSWQHWRTPDGAPVNRGPYGLLEGVLPDIYCPDGNIYGAGQAGTIGAASTEVGSTTAVQGP